MNSKYAAGDALARDADPATAVRRKLSTRGELVNALEQMINVFYGYRKMGLQEMQTMEQATKVLRRT